MNPDSLLCCDEPLERERPVDENEALANWIESLHERDEADDLE